MSTSESKPTRTRRYLDPPFSNLLKGPNLVEITTSFKLCEIDSLYLVGVLRADYLMAWRTGCSEIDCVTFEFDSCEGAWCVDMTTSCL